LALSGWSDCRCSGRCTIWSQLVALDFERGLEAKLCPEQGCTTTFSEGSSGMQSLLPDGGPDSRSVLKCWPNCRAVLFHEIL